MKTTARMMAIVLAMVFGIGIGISFGEELPSGSNVTQEFPITQTTGDVTQTVEGSTLTAEGGDAHVGDIKLENNSESHSAGGSAQASAKSGDSTSKLEVKDSLNSNQHQAQAVIGSGNSKQAQAVIGSGNSKQAQAVIGSGNSKQAQAVIGSGNSKQTQSADNTGNYQTIQAARSYATYPTVSFVSTGNGGAKSSAISTEIVSSKCVKYNGNYDTNVSEVVAEMEFTAPESDVIMIMTKEEEVAFVAAGQAKATAETQLGAEKAAKAILAKNGCEKFAAFAIKENQPTVNTGYGITVGGGLSYAGGTSQFSGVGWARAKSENKLTYTVILTGYIKK